MNTANKGLTWDLKTAERRVRVAPSLHPLYTTRMTKRMDRIDPTLLAVARGEIDPEDGQRIVTRRDRSVPPVLRVANPFRYAITRKAGIHDDVDVTGKIPVDPYGGLIPVLDDGEVIEVEDDWISNDVEPEPFSQ